MVQVCGASIAALFRVVRVHARGDLWHSTFSNSFSSWLIPGPQQFPMRTAE